MQQLEFLFLSILLYLITSVCLQQQQQHVIITQKLCNIWIGNIFVLILANFRVKVQSVKVEVLVMKPTTDLLFTQVNPRTNRTSFCL